MTVLFIGNGFDLALKLKTSYRDFVNSDFWPIRPEDPSTHSGDSLKNSIYNFTERFRDPKSGLVRWIDVEGLMHSYALEKKNESSTPNRGLSDYWASDNKQFLEILKSQFASYLRHNVKETIDPKKHGVDESLTKVFDAINSKDRDRKVYSFNYTDSASILSSIFNWENPNVTHLHGRVTDSYSDMILGINDRDVVDKNHRFLLKSHQEGFKSNNLFDDLRKAHTVIFYGLSFGANDMDYFKDYFLSVIKQELPLPTLYQVRAKRNIFIFTLDAQSEADIKSFFEDADVSVRDLFLNANLEFIQTSRFGDGGKGDLQLESFINFCKPPEYNPFGEPIK